MLLYTSFSQSVLYFISDILISQEEDRKDDIQDQEAHDVSGA